jgi:hypothetical protein
VKSYVYPVVIETDEDVWRAFVPELESKGAATWGHTREEALKGAGRSATSLWVRPTFKRWSNWSSRNCWRLAGPYLQA